MGGSAVTTFEFGDFEMADAADTETPEAVPTARIYQNYRAAKHGDPSFSDLSDEEQALLAYVFATLIGVHWALTASGGAQMIITLKRLYSIDHTRKRWSQLSTGEKSVEVAMAFYILNRLARETGKPWDRD